MTYEELLEDYQRLQADYKSMMNNYIDLLYKVGQIESERAPNCGECKIKMTEVRPGKFQCDNGECLNYQV